MWFRVLNAALSYVTEIKNYAGSINAALRSAAKTACFSDLSNNSYDTENYAGSITSKVYK